MPRRMADMKKLRIRSIVVNVGWSWVLLNEEEEDDTFFVYRQYLQESDGGVSSAGPVGA